MAGSGPQCKQMMRRRLFGGNIYSTFLNRIIAIRFCAQKLLDLKVALLSDKSALLDFDFVPNI